MVRYHLFFLVVLPIIYNLVVVLRADFAKLYTSNNSSDYEGNELHSQFKHFVTSFNKSYVNDPREYTKRKGIFKESLIRQFQLNQKEKLLGGRAVYGVNKFSDMTTQEFKEFLRRSHIRPSQGTLFGTPKNPEPDLCKVPQKDHMPTHWNWHEQGKVTSIKNQGKVYYTLAPESECPYEDKQTDCIDTLKHSKSGVTIKRPCSKYRADEMSYIKPVVAFVGTVSVNVDATQWHDYLSGIIQHHCSAIDINHAVQIVGFDTKGVVPYWIVRNSWGTEFGDQGYLYIEMGKNLCGKFV
ncbi:hypothetical protein QZH41_016579 [Actinostola sp. cb2023]|nr:hypothetical protein QZH41_016579 [Actinostola sp. cb2023]